MAQHLSGKPEVMILVPSIKQQQTSELEYIHRNTPNINAREENIIKNTQEPK